MPSFFSNIHPTIRQKVVLGFSLSFAAFVLIGLIGYRNLARIDRKLRFVRTASELHDTILEVRRYEKNFLLYGLRRDYDQALNYVKEVKGDFTRIQPEVKALKGAIYLQKLQKAMVRYEGLLSKLGPDRGGESWPQNRKKVFEARLRQAGKQLVDLSLQLANFEYRRIEKIVMALKAKLVSLILVLCLLGMFLTLLVSHKIVKPLKVIEKTTERIARGDFNPLPVRQTADETQVVVEAFNRMVAELERRQDQLVQAQKLSSLGILTSGIAHQLNNPLNNISTSCQILLEEVEADDGRHVRKLLSNIDQEVDRARDIVKGLLEFSREREFQLDWVSIKELISKTTRLVSSQLPPGVEISSQIPGELEIYADGQKLQEVILNLLLNAAQAMPEGTGSIQIRAREERSQGEVEITIKDSGCGIPPEDLPRIFDPFFSTKEVGFGTGLGLSVAHGIVERHGGTITAQSKVGEGSTFTIRLPIKGRCESGVEPL